MRIDLSARRARRCHAQYSTPTPVIAGLCATSPEISILQPMAAVRSRRTVPARNRKPSQTKSDSPGSCSSWSTPGCDGSSPPRYASGTSIRSCGARVPGRAQRSCGPRFTSTLPICADPAPCPLPRVPRVATRAALGVRKPPGNSHSVMAENTSNCLRRATDSSQSWSGAEDVPIFLTFTPNDPRQTAASLAVQARPLDRAKRAAALSFRCHARMQSLHGARSLRRQGPA